MGIVYLAALVVALGVLGVQLLGGHDAHDAGGEHAGDGDHDAGRLALFLSLRFWTFALLAFGFSGGLMHVLALASPFVVALVASVAGLASGAFAVAAFRLVARRSASTTPLASEAVGRIGRVLVACAPGQVGKVRVELQGSRIDLLATTDDDAIARGDEVLVDDVNGDVAHVSRRPPELA